MNSQPIGHRTHGQGPHHVLVFHGWFGDSQVFSPMYPALDPALYTFVFVEQRGYGESIDREGPFTIEQVAHDGLALADSLGWDRFSVVGHSMGGAVAQRLCASAPDRVRALVLLSAVPASGVPLDEQGHGLFYGAPESDENCFGIVDFTTGNRLPAAWVQSVVAHTRKSCTRESFAAYLPSWQKADFADALHGSKVPALAIVGENDPALSAAVMNAAVLPHFEDARLETLTNAGHYPMQETPIALAASIVNFLSDR